MPLAAAGSILQTHRGLRALVTLLFILASAAPLLAGGGWVAKPGHGGIRIGYDWKFQPGALRRDVRGDLFRSEFSLTHDYRFLYLSGDVGVLPGFEASALLTYLWADESVDASSEDPSWHYHGPSDMWLGLKYQVLDGDYPTAIAANVRLPWLYAAASIHNGQKLTNITGLLDRDYEINASVSHSFNDDLYGSLTGGFRLREGAITNQILFLAETGGTLPMLDRKIFGKIVVDGALSVGEPEESTSRDRFDGRTTVVAGHPFDYNNASYIRPGIELGYKITPDLGVSAGLSYIVWGHSIDVYREVLLQAGYSF
jgi:hypothetical protein